MQSKSQAFPIRRFLILSSFLFAAAAFFANPARAQLDIQGYGKQGGATITGVVSKGAGQADITITGVVLAPGLSYCLPGVGRGKWYGKKIDGGHIRFDLTKTPCSTPVNGTVTISVKNDKFETQPVVGHVPVALNAEGVLIETQDKRHWLSYPVGSQKFKGDSDIIAIFWNPDGKPRLANAAEAATLAD